MGVRRLSPAGLPHDVINWIYFWFQEEQKKARFDDDDAALALLASLFPALEVDVKPEVMSA